MLELHPSACLATHLVLSVLRPAAQEANNYFLRAIQSNTHDSYAIFQYAQFLDRCGLIKKAEEFYLRSLEVRPLLSVPPSSLTGESLITRLASMRADQSQQRGVLAGVR